MMGRAAILGCCLAVFSGAASPTPSAPEGEPATANGPPAPSAAAETDGKAPPAEPAPAQAGLVSETRNGMGGRVEIKIFGLDGPETRAAITAGFAELDRLEALLSEWRPDSDISRINQSSGQAPTRVSPETLAVLSTGLEVSRLSHGAFSLTWGALAGVWSFDARQQEPTIPSGPRLTERLALIDDTQLIVNATAQTAQLKKTGMTIGLGGIAKGYAVQQTLALLRSRGIDNALVFVGGDIGAIGSKGNQPWLVGLQDPRANGYFAVLPLKNRAIATSGDYQHFFERDGKRYHHVLNPKTGRPASGCRSVTVVAARADWADALATAVFVLGPDAGLELIEARNNVEAVIVDADNEVRLSSGLQQKLRIIRPPSS